MNKDWQELLADVEREQAERADVAVLRFKNALAARKAAEQPNPHKPLIGEFATAPVKKQGAELSADPRADEKPRPPHTSSENPGDRPKAN